VGPAAGSYRGRRVRDNWNWTVKFWWVDGNIPFRGWVWRSTSADSLRLVALRRREINTRRQRIHRENSSHITFHYTPSQKKLFSAPQYKYLPPHAKLVDIRSTNFNIFRQLHGSRASSRNTKEKVCIRHEHKATQYQLAATLPSDLQFAAEQHWPWPWPLFPQL
jgi:hypothetical protein